MAEYSDHWRKQMEKADEARGFFHAFSQPLRQSHALKALREWQASRQTSEPFQVPTYAEFCRIVQAIERDG